MKIKLTLVDKSVMYAKDIISFSLLSDYDTACDALRLGFLSEKIIKDVVFVSVFDNKKLLFCGKCDYQEQEEKGDNIYYFIYARSLGALLCDNGAEPITLNCPSDSKIFDIFIKKFGVFTNSLPNITISDTYEISRGTSCYGALNNFVSNMTGSNIYVTPNGEIKLLEKSKSAIFLNDFDILSLKMITERSNPIRKINYKLDTSEGYVRHYEAKIDDDALGLNEQFMNLSPYPVWQRERILKKKIENSFSDYKRAEIKLLSVFDIALMSFVSFNFHKNKEIDYYLTNKKIVLENGIFKTTLILKKNKNIKGVNYVD